MRYYTKHITIWPEALQQARAVLEAGGYTVEVACCPACGRTLPTETARYTLHRDGGPVVYCPTCGAEWGVQDA